MINREDSLLQSYFISKEIIFLWMDYSNYKYDDDYVCKRQTIINMELTASSSNVALCL